MRLKFKDSEEVCVSLKYVKEKNIFCFQDSKQETICEYFPQLTLDSAYDSSQYKYLLLHNEREDYSENSIFQVYVEKQRIGWIFPMQALLSKQHNYADNKFFIRYAYVALWLLLDNINSIDTKEFTLEIFLEDFYDDSLTVLVLDDSNISQLKEPFCMKNYIVSLYQKGYAYSGRGNLDSQIEKIDVRLNLKPIARELREINYIYTMFEREIPKNHEAFAKFHIYYQIIEILISVIFEDRFKKFISQLNTNVETLFDQRDNLGEMVQEKRRVKWLFAEYVTISQREKGILDEQCKRLLKKNGKKVGEEMAENLYSVRCLLVHNLFKLDDDSHRMLIDINKAFLDVIMEVLHTFHIPQ